MPKAWYTIWCSNPHRGNIATMIIRYFFLQKNIFNQNINQTILKHKIFFNISVIYVHYNFIIRTVRNVVIKKRDQ